MKPDERFGILEEQPDEFFKLIPQKGVTHYLVEEEPTHNAIWDMCISPEKTVFFSVCGESYAAEYARLYEFNPKTRQMKHHFNLEEKLIHQEQSLRTSKLHTAMCCMGDGRIITTTHTTSPSPRHKLWMPYEYANHQWEGYQGSNILIYNYRTGELENRGVISPYDTTYGGTYCPETGDYFCTTWMMGKGYVYDVNTGEHRCMGQVSDTATSRTFLCSDGNIYGSTYSGRMFRYNKEKRDIEYLDADLGDLLRHAAEYQGTLYITTGPCGVAGRGQELFAYELATGKLERLGRPVPKIGYSGDSEEVYMNAYGMAIDSKGRLWYGCMTHIPGITYCGTRLYMWDVINGKEPVDYGFLGTPKRTVSIPAEMRIVDDVLYISDGNHVSHEDTCCGLLVIDLKTFEEAAAGEERLYSHDYMNYIPYPLSCAAYYPKDDYEELWNLYRERYELNCTYKKFQQENWYRKRTDGVIGISYWEQIGRENTVVHSVVFRDDSHFYILCGQRERYCVEAEITPGGEGKILEISKTQLEKVPERKVQLPENLRLPFLPGRQHLAFPESCVPWQDGAVLVGTGDMMLARVKGDQVFGLGAVCTCGGVHSLCVMPDGKKAYGVCGYEMGIGSWFSYDETVGVQNLGYIPDVFASNGRKVCIYHPTTLAVSPDGKYLAIGGSDELSGVVVIRL